MYVTAHRTLNICTMHTHSVIYDCSCLNQTK